MGDEPRKSKFCFVGEVANFSSSWLQKTPAPASIGKTLTPYHLTRQDARIHPSETPSFVEAGTKMEDSDSVFEKSISVLQYKSRVRAREAQ